MSKIEITKDKIIVKISKQAENEFFAYIIEKDKVDDIIIKTPAAPMMNKVLKISNIIGKKIRANIDTLGNFGVESVVLENKTLLISITTI